MTMITMTATTFKFNSDAVAAVKALAILLMVMGHSGCPTWLQQYFVMFRMPIFFAMSGYCFKAKYIDDARTFVMRRVTGVWWPYVKWGFVFLALHNVLFCLNIYNDVYGYRGEVSHLYGWDETARYAAMTLVLCHSEQLLGGYWFLHELFFASLFGYAAIKYLKKFKYAGGGVLLLLFATAFASERVHVPVITARTWMATFFFLLGHAWRNNEEAGGMLSRYDGLSPWRKAVVIVTLAVGVKAFQVIAGRADMTHITLANAAPYLGGAVCGVVMSTYVCRWIVSRGADAVTRFLTFTGRHTFEVLTWHFICLKLVSLLIIAVYGLAPERLATFPVISTQALRQDGCDISWTLWWIVYWIVGAGVPIAWQAVRLRGGKEKRRY